MKMRRIANASCLLLSVTVSSVSFAVAQPGGQPSLAAIRAACADDAQKLCAGVQPGGGRIVACLKEHKDSLSDRCKQAAGLAANPGSSSAPSAAGAHGFAVGLRCWFRRRRPAPAPATRGPRTKAALQYNPCRQPLRPAEKSSSSASSRIRNIRECAPQPFTCPRSGTSRARSSGTTTGSRIP